MEKTPRRRTRASAHHLAEPPHWCGAFFYCHDWLRRQPRCRLSPSNRHKRIHCRAPPSTLLLPSYGRAADGWSMWRLTERTRQGHMDVNAQTHNDRTEDACYVNTQTHMQSAHLALSGLTLT